MDKGDVQVMRPGTPPKHFVDHALGACWSGCPISLLGDAAQESQAQIGTNPPHSNCTTTETNIALKSYW